MKKPDWLRVRIGSGAQFKRVADLVRNGGLHTVCEEALCPNRGACWEHGRATLLILGATCSRGCTFCNVASGTPAPPDTDEPARVAGAVRAMGLRDVVLTSVTRDDLPDGGAAHWAATIRAVQAAVPGICVEVLVPDFGGDAAALDTVLAARPDVLAHNLETVPRLYPAVRPEADYARSLAVLRRAHAAGCIVKTGIMAGLGETDAEIETLMRDAHAAGAALFTIGQYLQPSRRHRPVARYVEPAVFDAYRDTGRAIGFAVVLSAPLVRSSLHAEEQSAYVARRRAAGGASASFE
jgi:lipoyl synthase